MHFEDFDSRGYRCVDVRTGYGEWVGHYEDTVEDAMDIALLDQLTTPTWHQVRRAVDLACGTGRTGAWLRGRGVPAVDGVDLTPEMLRAAQRRGAHDRLFEADVRETGLPGGAYDLATISLADEHLPELDPLYREAARLTGPEAVLVLVSYHPHFMMLTGMPTHYDSPSGEPVTIAMHVHLVSDHVRAALGAGWQLAEMRERVIDDEWVELKPKWERYRNHPVSMATAWLKAG